jgi:hypothetical protein
MVGLENGIVQELMVILAQLSRLFRVLNLIKRILIARGLFGGVSHGEE